jgi:hypothetical protein
VPGSAKRRLAPLLGHDVDVGFEVPHVELALGQVAVVLGEEHRRIELGTGERLYVGERVEKQDRLELRVPSRSRRRTSVPHAPGSARAFFIPVSSR